MAGTKTLITADQLERMSFPDERVELSEGELIRMPPAGIDASYIGGELFGILRDFVREKKLGIVLGADAGFRLDPHTVRSPDVSFIAHARVKAAGKPKGFWPGAPDLAVEVFSPSDSRTELAKKIKEYFRAGTRAVWAVFPEARQVYVYRSPKEITVLEPGGTLTGGDVLPGFSVSVRRIFE